MKYLLAALICFFHILSNAQENKNLDFSLSGGINIPTGQYGKTIDDDAGYAVQGFNINTEIVYHVINSLGIGINASYFENSLNKNALEEDLGLGTWNGFEFHLDLERWKNIQVMAGPYYVLQFENIGIQLKILPGILRTNFPGRKYSTTTTWQRDSI